LLKIEYLRLTYADNETLQTKMGYDPREKFYFLTPVTGLPPRGAIQLGSIISLPRMVTSPVNKYPPYPSTFAERVEEYNTYNGTVKIDKNTDMKTGIFVKFLQSIGIDGGIKGENSNKDSEDWSFQNLKTVEFVPSDAYVAQATGDMDVQNWLYTQRESLLSHSKSLYMVVGTKIAYGASSTLGYANSKRLNIHVGVDLTPLGVPVNVGPNIEVQNDLNVSQGGDHDRPFVFAFRLRKIKLYSSGDTKQEDVKGGTLLGIGSKDEDELKPKFNVVVKGLEDADANADEFRMPSTSVVDAIDEAAPGKTTAKAARAK
jgi:hypothetical protein